MAAVSLAFCLGASALAACSGEKAGRPNGQEAGASAPGQAADWQKTAPGSGGIALPVVRTPVEYSFMAQEDAGMPFRNTFVVVPGIEKRTNVKFNLNKVPQTNYKDKLNVVLASGEIPDVMAGVDVSVANSLGPKGLFLNIWQYIDAMPNMKKAFETYPEMNNFKYSDNELYSILNQCSPDSDPQGFGYYTFVPMIRTDVLNKLNLKAPTNFDELHTVLAEMKKAYPSSYPWINYKGLEGFLQQMLLAWNGSVLDYTANYAAYDSKSSKWSFGPEQPGFKEMVDYLRKLYAEGLLDKEFMVTNQTQWEERVINDKGFFSYASWNVSDYMTRKGVEKGTADFYFTGFVPPKKDGPSSVVVRPVCTNYSAVSAKVKDPVPLLQALDYWLYSKDGAMLANAGEEGVNFTWEQPDQIYKLVDPELPNPSNETHSEKFGIRYSFMTGLRPDHFDIHNHLDNPDRDLYHQQYLAYRGRNVSPAPVKIFKNTEDADQMKQIGVPIKDYVAQQVTKFIAGAVSMSEWDGFIQTSKKMGSDKMVELLNKP